MTTYYVGMGGNNSNDGDIMAHWAEATPAQKQAFIDGSPLLKWILEWSDQWQR